VISRILLDAADEIERGVKRLVEKDRAKATAEYLAEFRTDLEGFVTLRARVRRGGRSLL
jgi:hypothetical protein